MQLPDERNPIWIKVIEGKGEYQFSFLAFKILLGRLNLHYRQNPSPQEVGKSVRELREFCEKCMHIKSLQADLEKIF